MVGRTDGTPRPTRSSRLYRHGSHRATIKCSIVRTTAVSLPSQGTTASSLAGAVFPRHKQGRHRALASSHRPRHRQLIDPAPTGAGERAGGRSPRPRPPPVRRRTRQKTPRERPPAESRPSSAQPPTGRASSRRMRSALQSRQSHGRPRSRVWRRPAWSESKARGSTAFANRSARRRLPPCPRSRLFDARQPRCLRAWPPTELRAVEGRQMRLLREGGSGWNHFGPFPRPHAQAYHRRSRSLGVARDVRYVFVEADDGPEAEKVRSATAPADRRCG